MTESNVYPIHRDKPLVIYHAGCRDGFASAWVAWFALEGPELVPANYGSDLPEITNRDVFIIDFSYPRAVMLEIAALCKSLVVLDHHKTAEADLKDLPVDDLNVKIVFDMKRSGAGIAWDYFHPGSPRPWIVSYVEDRDLWNWKLRASREINAYLQTTRYDLRVWDEVFGAGPDHAEAIGRELIRVQDDRNIALTDIMMQRVEWAGFGQVPVINAPTEGISELMEAILLTTKAPFCLGWRIRKDGALSVSLRSTAGPDSFDVSAAAQMFGGGGHRNAAGFELQGFDAIHFLKALLKGEKS